MSKIKTTVIGGAIVGPAAQVLETTIGPAATYKEGCQHISEDQDPLITSPIKFCGCKDLFHKSYYCKEHYAIMFQRGTTLGRRQEDANRAGAIWALQSEFNSVVLELEEEGAL